MSRKMFLLFTVILLGMFSFLTYMWQNTPPPIESSKVQKKKPNKCYADCCAKSMKQIDKLAPHCITKIGKQERWDADCIRRAIFIIADACKNECK